MEKKQTPASVDKKEQPDIFQDFKDYANPQNNTNLSLQEYLDLGKAGHRYIPLIRKLYSDCLTPVGAFMALSQKEDSFLLESVEKGINVGRYSFIGLNPLLKVSGSNSGVKKEYAGSSAYLEGDPLEVLAESIRELKVAPVQDFPVFYGGAVGYLSYDYVRQIEKLPQINPDHLNLPTSFWMVPRKLILFDHVTKEIAIIVLTPAGGEEDYHQANQEINEVLLQIGEGRSKPPDKTSLPETESITSTFAHSDFLQAVEKAKDYIFAGDIFQVVLSQRLSFPFEGDPFAFYRVLRTVNPSPYLFYLDCGDHQVVGSSPEMMVRLSADEAEVRPIAGTRPRFLPGRSEESIVEELLKDEKERAEHLMLVDLGRNDLGRVCEYGTVKVEDFMAVERYSHVFHLVSRVTGKLRPEDDCFGRALSLMRAVFPAGTLSGAPKVRAMEIIEELEPCRRGIYGGTVGYIGFDGKMDTCIAIRTAIATKGFMHLQAGAGIVADSDPEKEFQETLFKLKALFKSFSLLEKGGEGWL